jgi:hypothetical protein
MDNPAKIPSNQDAIDKFNDLTFKFFMEHFERHLSDPEHHHECLASLVIDIRQVPKDGEAQSFVINEIDQELDKAQLKFPPLNQGDINRFERIVSDFLRSDDRILISDLEYIAGPSDIVVVIAHEPGQGVEVERTPIRRVITRFIVTQQTDEITNME